MEDDYDSGRKLSLAEKAKILNNLTFYPALTVMVLSRRGLGYRLLNPAFLVVMALIVYFVGIFCYRPDQPVPDAMSWYAASIVILGIRQRVKRWSEMRKGVATHSWSTGISIFQFSWLPRFLTRQRHFNRAIDPALVALAGAAACEYVSIVLGFWLLFAAACAHFWEQSIFEKAIETDLDIADGMITAEGQSQVVKHFDRQGTTAYSARNVASAIPTGVSEDIKTRIRKKRNGSRRSSD